MSHRSVMRTTKVCFDRRYLQNVRYIEGLADMDTDPSFHVRSACISQAVYNQLKKYLLFKTEFISRDFFSGGGSILNGT